MSFKATLEVAGKKYAIIQCHFDLEQMYGNNGKPASGVRGGKITFILEGTDDVVFGSWIGKPTEQKDGKVIFYRTDQRETKFKEVNFEGAYLLTLIESFSAEDYVAAVGILEGNSLSTDIGPGDDEDSSIIKYSVSDLLRCQQATGQSYCMLLRISAEKITIDGVEHQN